MTHKIWKTGLNWMLALGLCMGNVQTFVHAEEELNPVEEETQESAAPFLQEQDPAQQSENDMNEGPGQENAANDMEQPGEEENPSGAAVVENDSDLTMENHSLIWTTASNKYSIDENGLHVVPETNSEASATALLTYSCGGNESIPVGKAEIRLPAYILKDRSGNPIGTVELSIPKAPETGGVTSFNYYIDDHGTSDKSDDEIVVVNYREIPEGGFFMKSDIVWKWDVTQVANDFSATEIKASFSTAGSGGGEALTAKSESLSLDVKTGPKLGSGSKKETQKYESWNTAWGEKPEDADDYFYVCWLVSQSVTYSQTTAPYFLYIREASLNLGKGEIVTFKDTRGNVGSTDFVPFDGMKSAEERLNEMNETPVYTANDLQQINRVYSFTREIIVRYPKSMADGQPFTLNNKAEAEAISVDGVSSNLVKTSGDYNYEYVNMDIPNYRDYFSTYKRASANYTDANARYYSYKGALNMLKNGTSVEMSWNIFVHQNGWNRTQNGTKEYDTVLRDGMMYINGERLKDGDYDLTSFYPYSFNTYVKVFDENTGASLQASKDAADYEPIVVYTRGVDGTWTEFGSLTKLDETIVRFTGEDGSTKDCKSSVSSTFAEASRVLLPKGTKDIKYVHRGKEYGVDYRMGLYYRLYPTEHVLGLIGSSANVKLYNISEAWGEQDGNKYTVGNKITDSSLSNLKSDVESSDAQEYGDGSSSILHDYSWHELTEVKGTGSFYKNMGTPVNDINKATVKIPVTMTWDYYLNYKSLGVTLDEAINAKVINEAKEAYIYDLLPIGVTIDLSSIKVTPYSTTNLDGKTLKSCEYTVELVNDWRESGRTMVIINAKVPEDFRNFAKSSTYANTGFKVYFDMYDSWDNIAINGKTLVNDAGLYTMEGAVPNGVSDTGVGSKVADLFKDLQPAGADTGLENNVRYAQASKTLIVPTAAQIGFSKSVKGAGDVAYSMDGTKVPATGEYSYQMRFSLRQNSTADSVVLYDILETANAGNPNWMGTFKSIDVSQIRLQYPDVDVKVYYSTSKDLPDLQGPSAHTVLDVTNTKIWSLDRPMDPASVTAVAVDISKDKQGNVYTFKGEMALAALIYMEAPKEYIPYVDDPATSVDETVFAYNRSFIAQSGEKVEGSNTVRTQVEKPKASIVKRADPISGTSLKPTIVEYNDVLTYTLDVMNQNKADSMHEMKVEDVLPEGLEIQEDQIQYWFGTFVSGKTTVGANKRVQAEVDGQKITFTIDTVMANETVHLSIPVRVTENARGQATYENTAKITGFNGGEYEYVSNTTYHEGKPVKFDLNVNKEWNDEKDKYGLRSSVLVDVFRVDGTTRTLLKTVELTKNNGYAQTVTDLYRYLSDGVTEIRYEVEEREVAGYPNVEYVFNKDTDTWTITNTPVVEKDQAVVNFNVTKYKEGTAEVVEGVTFTLRDHNGVVSTATTGADGVVAFSYAPASTRDTVELTLTEDSVPVGYTKLEHPVNITLTRSDVPVYSIKDNKIVESRGWSITTDMEYRNGSYVLTNPYNPLPVTVPFTLSKQMVGDVVRPEDKTFTFHVVSEKSTDPQPNQSAYQITVTPDEQTGQTRGSIKFTEPGTYTYTITEVNGGTVDHPEYGYSYALEKNGASSSYTYVVTVEDVQGQLTVTKQMLNGTEVTGTINAKFANEFKYKKVDVTLTMEKGFTADSHVRPQERDFTFQVEPLDGAPLPKDAAGTDINTVTVHGAGSGSLPTMTFETPGEYKYRVYEINDASTGYTFDQTEYEVKITVQATGTNLGELKAASIEYRKTKDVQGNLINETAQSIRVENTYIPQSVRFALPIGKVIEETSGSAAPNETFTFTLLPIGTAPSAEQPVVSIKGAGEGQFELNFDRAGTYTYLIKETPGTTHGYTYDDHVYTAVVTVMDNNGQLEARWSLDGTPVQPTDKAVFTNSYEPDPVSFVLPIEKTISGHETTSAKTFDFKITAVGDAPLPAEDTVSITGDGTTAFDEIRFVKAGTYAYKVQEIPGTEQGYKYDATIHDVEIVVRDENGVLKAEWSGNRNRVTFMNAYHPIKTSVQLKLTKQFTEDSADRPEAKDLIFNLATETTDAPLPVDTKLILSPQAGDHTKTDSGMFGAIEFTSAGTYEYKITEDLTGLTGYSSDAPVATVTVHVEDQDGQLISSVTTNSTDGSVIVNRYQPLPSEEKSLDLLLKFTEDSHDRPTSKDFRFQITSETGPKFEETDITLKCNGGVNTETQSGSFGSIQFTGAGTYIYTIKQINKDYNGYGFDLAEQMLEVTVEDQNGQLVITNWKLNGIDTTQVVMINSYHAKEVKFALPVEKIVRGSTRRDPFTFLLTSVNGSPMPVTDRVQIIGAGTTSFEEMTFEKAGDYVYELKEEVGSAPCSYDKAVHAITIRVEDEDGELKASMLVDGTSKEAVSFTNVYPSSTNSTPSGSTTSSAEWTGHGPWTPNTGYSLVNTGVE